MTDRKYSLTERMMFFIPGIPKPAGSKSAFPIKRKDGSLVYGKGGRQVITIVDASGKKGKEWRKTVASYGMQNWIAVPYTGKMYVDMLFLMPRPKCHYRTGKYEHLLKESSPLEHQHLQTPDSTKLLRAAEDALTGIIWHDDSQLAVSADKVWVTAPEDKQGMLITVRWGNAKNQEEERTQTETEDEKDWFGKSQVELALEG